MTMSFGTARARFLFCRQFAVMVVLIWLALATQEVRANYAAVDLFTLAPPPGTDPTEIVVANGFQPPAGYVPQAAAGGQVVGRTMGGSFGLLWNHNSQPIVLGSNQEVWATSGTQQVGDAGFQPTHAMLWNGSQASAVDLNPTNLSGITQSWAYGTSGTKQVGVGAGNDTVTGPNLRHALLWNGTAASAIDLNPAGFVDSYAFGTDGVHQVGQGNSHAVLWSGTPQSAVDLNPAKLGMSLSWAIAVSGNEQVGIGSDLVSPPHAILWRGTADSAVDLNPAGFSSSFALASNGQQQVGYGQSNTDRNDHALLWSGTAASAVDLGALIPATTIESKALSIDSAGNIYGVAIYSPNVWHAIEWVPVPEPSVLCLVGAAAAAALFRRRR